MQHDISQILKKKRERGQTEAQTEEHGEAKALGSKMQREPGEPAEEGWAFDGVSFGVFMTRQRQQRNELTDQSFLLASLDQ